MTLPVRWTTRAAAQLEEAALYLEKERTGAGMEMVDLVEAIVQAAADHPGLFPRVPRVPGKEVRRGLVLKYGYWVIYEPSPAGVLVLSVWHAARKPEGWRSGP